MGKENEINFSNRELQRYARHFSLPQVGREGQAKLKSSRVLCIGAGGLGCPLLQYLVAAGVGHIGIVDFDDVEASNLQRQVLYRLDDCGKNKAQQAKLSLEKLNPDVTLRAFPVKLTMENAKQLFSEYDVIADGSDNFPTRYLVNDACVLYDKVNVHAAIFQFEGQVSVFNMLDKNGKRGPNYRDVFPQPPPPNTVPNCAEAGVLGVLPGIVGALQATEVIKILTGIGEVLSGKMLLLDTLTVETRILKIAASPDNPLTGENPSQFSLIDYDQFCNLDTNQKTTQTLKEVTVQELKAMLDNKEDIQVIDVREQYEYDIANIGGELIPLTEILLNVDKINKQKKVIIHCRSGGRSSNAITLLEQELGYENLYNLKGGILAYADEIDPTLTKY